MDVVHDFEGMKNRMTESLAVIRDLADRAMASQQAQGTPGGSELDRKVCELEDLVTRLQRLDLRKEGERLGKALEQYGPQLRDVHRRITEAVNHTRRVKAIIALADEALGIACKLLGI